MGGASGIPDVNGYGIFELDGNVTHDATTVAPLDWAAGTTSATAGGGLFNADSSQAQSPGTTYPVPSGPGGDTATLITSKFLADTVGPDLAFITGGSKDLKNPAGNWQCTVKPVTPKDEIQNAYASAFQLHSTNPLRDKHIVLYLGLERGIVTGTSNAAFWLFQKNIGCGSSTGNFTGDHANGDVLLFATFNGGSASIQAFNWSGDATGSLSTVPLEANPNACSVNTADLCGQTNLTNVVTPWPPSSSTASAISPNGFFEAGIDLTTLFSTLHRSVPCLSTMLADTRASGTQGNAVSSDLHDYISGPFTLCSANISTTPRDSTGKDISGGTILLGESATDDATVTTTVAGFPAPTGSVNFFVCGPFAPPITTSSGCADKDPTKVLVEGTEDSDPSTDPTVGEEGLSAGMATSDPFTPLATGVYCFRSVYVPDTAASNNGYESVSEGHSGECFTVVQVTPKVKSTMYLADAVTVTHMSGAGPVDGSVTFSLYGPFAAAPGDDGCVAANLATGQSPNNPNSGIALMIDVNGDGTAHTKAAIAIPAITSAFYAWGITYTPSASNTHYTSASLSCTAEQVNASYVPPSGYVPAASTLTISP
ncbi:MAG: hypothetical protein E6J14_11665 [Chloroflexi bacterium]|nr:MAG: hypothetical protein E6J14_11665 [Chloroflexota bacterium]